MILVNSNLKKAILISYTSWFIVILGRGVNFFIHHSINQAYSLNPIEVSYVMIGILLYTFIGTSLKGVSGFKISFFTFLITGGTVLLVQIFVGKVKFAFYPWLFISLILVLISVFETFIFIKKDRIKNVDKNI